MDAYYDSLKKEFDEDMNRMSRQQFRDALTKAGFEILPDIVPDSIPKALIVLKNHTNTYNWKKCRNYLLKFLSRKKEIKGFKYHSEYQELLSKKFYDGVDEIKFGEGGEMSIDSIKSHLRNVLNTFRAEPYRSEFVAYVADSYNYGESGNKKYPELA
jgi:hypothetical protein